jgi:hypothetical protein
MDTYQTIAKAVEYLTWGIPDAPEVTVEEVVDFLGEGERVARGEAWLEWFDDEEVEILKEALDLEFEAASIAAALAMDAKADTYWIRRGAGVPAHDDAEAALRSWRRLHQYGD